MFRWISLLIAVVALLASGCRPPPPPQDVGAGAALWRLSDADSTVWIFGSAHLLPPDLRWRSAALDQAFEQAEVIVFEVDPVAAHSEETAQAFFTLGAAPPGQKLSSLLTKEDADRLGRTAMRYGLSLNALDSLQPWFAAQQVALAAALSQGVSPESGVETVLGRQAAASGRAIEALETPLEQVRVLADLPLDAQMQFFTSGLRRMEEEANALQQVNEAWAAGDVDALEAEINAMQSAAGPVVQQALLDRRNRAWTPQIEAYLARDQDVFIVVGAAHLVGPSGVLSLLRARGHSIARVGAN